MRQKKIKISYDKESEVLSIEMKKAKSVDSEISDNLVIDYDKKGEVVRVNFYNFSFDVFKENIRQIKNFIHFQKASLSIK